MDLKEEQIIYKGRLNSKESFETAWRCPKMQKSVTITEIQNFGGKHSICQKYEKDFFIQCGQAVLCAL